MKNSKHLEDGNDPNLTLSPGFSPSLVFFPMNNFSQAPVMNNSEHLEDGNDLNLNLSLGFGSPKSARQFSPSLVFFPTNHLLQAPPMNNSEHLEDGNDPNLTLSPGFSPSLVFFPMNNFSQAPVMNNSEHLEDGNDLSLTLSLGFGSPKKAREFSPSPSPSTSTSPTSPETNTISSMEDQNTNTSPLLVSSSDANVDVNAATPALRRRPRRAPSKRPAKGKSDTVPAPFPWATDRRATVHSHKYLLENNILTITGEVHCKRCEHKFEVRLDLEEKVAELRKFIQKERDTMHDRAPAAWANPVLPKCPQCGRQNTTKPISTKKKAINWLFLLLSQMLGCCTLEQLKYFCKHTSNHRTGAKDRLIYLTYMSLCKQLVAE